MRNEWKNLLLVILSVREGRKTPLFLWAVGHRGATQSTWAKGYGMGMIHSDEKEFGSTGNSHTMMLQPLYLLKVPYQQQASRAPIPRRCMLPAETWPRHKCSTYPNDHGLCVSQMLCKTWTSLSIYEFSLNSFWRFLSAQTQIRNCVWVFFYVYIPLGVNHTVLLPFLD